MQGPISLRAGLVVGGAAGRESDSQGARDTAADHGAALQGPITDLSPCWRVGGEKKKKVLQAENQTAKGPETRHGLGGPRCRRRLLISLRVGWLVGGTPGRESDSQGGQRHDTASADHDAGDDY